MNTLKKMINVLVTYAHARFRIWLKARRLSKQFSNSLVTVSVRIVEQEDRGFYHHYVSKTKTMKPGVVPIVIDFFDSHHDYECPHPDCIVRKIMES
jgi:hypothetical protein